MSRFQKGSKEAKLWGEKMKLARDAKKAPTPKLIPKIEAPDFICSIVGKYFPEAGLKVQDRGADYVIEITIKEGDIRSFVVDKPTASIEIENWCIKIKANLEGKPLNSMTGTNLMTGMKEQMKKIPPEVGKDSEFFFRSS